ncbi:MAG: 50S ribosomal protein L9 [Candidatus Margulisbacteria bacterium]|nr:50S ribosomal protein L9 [Candidatus Margulisiibacteriota bacterium]
MRIILTEDDVRLGDKGSVVNVKKGYGVNFLIPGNKAVIYNAGNKAKLENEIGQQAKKIAKEKLEHQTQADKLKGVELNFIAKAALTGHIYGSITNQNVAEKIKEVTGLDIPKKKIAINTHIKTAGKYTANIKLFTGINATVSLVVTIEEETTLKK